jgi:hypothetical protein
MELLRCRLPYLGVRKHAVYELGLKDRLTKKKTEAPFEGG